MVAQVLYRKWRPRTFAQVAGQGSVTGTLSRAVATGRVAHAYLFCGPRGTGKTSTARILAKAVNCETPKDGDADDACVSCCALNEGRAMDLIEVDAASRRRVEDVQNILEKVYFQPAESRYKVYILDEVHMLSEASFNVFLKMLEEPPPHVIFILCTTEAHKIPATVISRCHRFDFRRIGIVESVERLGEISAEEGYQVEPEALRAIGRAAAGSLRDCCTLLEQVAISSGASVTLESVRELLGLGDDRRSLALACYALSCQTKDGLELINHAVGDGVDLRILQRDSVQHLRTALLMKSGVRDGIDYTKEMLEEIQAVVDKVSWGHVLDVLRLFSMADMRGEAPSPLPLEIAMVEASRLPMADQGSRSDSAELNTLPDGDDELESARQEGDDVSSPPDFPDRDLALQQVDSPHEHVSLLPPESIRSGSGTPAGFEPSDAVDGSMWTQLRAVLKGVRGAKNLDVGALLNSASARYVSGKDLVVEYNSRSNMERLQGELDDPACRRAVAEAIQRCLGISLNIRATMAAGENERRSSQVHGHLVRAAIAMGAKRVDEQEE